MRNAVATAGLGALTMGSKGNGDGLPRQNVPRTGTGFGSKVKPVVKKSEVKQRDAKGNILFEVTRKLWRK